MRQLHLHVLLTEDDSQVQHVNYAWFVRSFYIELEHQGKLDFALLAAKLNIPPGTNCITNILSILAFVQRC